MVYALCLIIFRSSLQSDLFDVLTNTFFSVRRRILWRYHSVKSFFRRMGSLQSTLVFYVLKQRSLLLSCSLVYCHESLWFCFIKNVSEMSLGNGLIWLDKTGGEGDVLKDENSYHCFLIAISACISMLSLVHDVFDTQWLVDKYASDITDNFLTYLIWLRYHVLMPNS